MCLYWGVFVCLICFWNLQLLNSFIFSLIRFKTRFLIDLNWSYQLFGLFRSGCPVTSAPTADKTVYSCCCCCSLLQWWLQRNAFSTVFSRALRRLYLTSAKYISFLSNQRAQGLFPQKGNFKPFQSKPRLNAKFKTMEGHLVKIYFHLPLFLPPHLIIFIRNFFKLKKLMPSHYNCSYHGNCAGYAYI